MQIKTGNYRNNIAWYIFVSNEYGKPTDKTKELFIDNFTYTDKNEQQSH